MQYSGFLIGVLRGSGAEMLGLQAAGDVRGVHKMITTAISRFLSWLLNFEVAKGCFLNGIFEKCRLVVMSATLGDDLAERLESIMSSSARAAMPSENGAASTDSTAEEPVANSLDRSLGEEAAGRCRLLSCEGRMFPVRTKYLGAPGTQRSLPHALFCCRVGPGLITCPASSNIGD